MKKILAVILLSLSFSNSVLAESYYFKKCLLNEVVSANYLIDLENKIINVILESSDGKIQKIKDKIDLIEKDKIITEKIKSSKSKDSFFIYFLDAKTESVVRQNYIKNNIGEINLVKPDGPKKKSYCADVKADWDEVKKKKALKKKKDEKIKKEKEDAEKRNKVKLENKKKKKELENKYKISIDGDKWIKLSKYNYESVEKNKLIDAFNKKALEICLSNSLEKFTVIRKKIGIVETDETPAFGTETVIKIGINGIIECK